MVTFFPLNGYHHENNYNNHIVLGRKKSDETKQPCPSHLIFRLI